MSKNGQLKLAFVIEAIDKATSNLTKINKTIDKLTEPARRVRASFRDLIKESRFERVSSAVTRVGDRFDALRSKVAGIVGGLSAIGAGAGAAAWGFKSVADRVDELRDSAKLIDVTTQELQRLGYAAQMNGSSEQEMAEALKFLSKNMGEAIGGSAELTQWFARMGISLQELRSGMGVTEVFARIADQFHGAAGTADNSARKIQTMMALMGRSGAGMRQTLELGRKKLNEFANEADRLGVTLSDETVEAMADFNDSFDRTKLTLFGALANMLKAIAPPLQKLLNQFAEWTGANRAMLATRFVEWLDEAIPTVKDFAGAVVMLVKFLAGLASAANWVVQALGGWSNVAAVVAGVITGQLVVALAGLGSALWGVAAAFLATPFGWFAAGIAAVIGLGVLIYKKWEPIKAFFVDLWDSIVAGLNKVNNLVPNWIKRIVPGAMLFDAAVKAVTPAPGAAPVPAAIAAPQASGRTEVGGTLNIKIDQDGRVKKTDLQKAPWSPMDFDVSYTGGPLALPM